jgi:ABC-2 type transport system permease protein
MSTTVSQPAASVAAPKPIRRIYGFGSVFGKSVRDSRRATLLVGGIMGLLLLVVCEGIVAEFATPASRQQLVDLIRSVPPILAGLAGRPIAVDTMGGYVQYKYGTFFPLIVSLWSILALSGTLAGEARRGSLEFIAASPMSRRRIALEKVLAHVTVLTVAMVVVFVAIAIAGSAIARLPGDAISVEAAAGFAIWLGLLALAGGALAFAISLFVGRSAAIGIAGAITFGGFILSGYQSAIPAIAPLANITWFGWTYNHVPLSGLYDWPSLVLVAVVAVVLLAVGIEAFARRDLGQTTSVPTLSLPHALAGLHGPFGRAIANALPSTLSWGLGIGFFGLVIASLGQSFADDLAKSPDLLRLLNSAFPGIDVASIGGWLELLFIEFGLVLMGLAAATLVSVWASDETSGRLELLLATPLGRAKWVVTGGIAMAVSVAVITVIAAIGIGIGSSVAGGDAATPFVGTFALGLFAIALIGIGAAVGGVVGTGPAAIVVAVIVILTWAADVLGPALNLPDLVRNLALTAHFGLPMVGRWDLSGVIASLVLGFGGVALGAWGFARRDVHA